MIDLENKKILIISPHPDDEVLGCGGLILRAKQSNAEIYVLYLTVGNIKQYGGASIIQDRIKEIEQVSDFLDFNNYDIAFPDDKHHLRLDVIPQKEIIDVIENESKVSLNKIAPDILAIPSIYSSNQDHIATTNAIFAATRIQSRAFKSFQDMVISYEDASYIWSPYGRFIPNFYLDISDVVGKKVKAMSLYNSQLKDELHPRNTKNLLEYSAMRGREVLIKAAECFNINRLVS